MSGEFAVAVHALVYLNHKESLVSSEALAQNVCTNPARIRKVMAKLKKGGYVETKEGTNGGYHFIGDPDKVTLKEICDAMDVKLVSSSWRSGSLDMECLIASGIGAIMDDIYAQLDDRCKKELSTLTIADIDRRIFQNKERV